MPDIQQIPPKGDLDKAEKYVNKLVDLINQNKIEVYHTDLKKFDPTSLQNHYTISLKDYQIEISHSIHPTSDKNSYVMIFNNLKSLAEGAGEKVILAYIYLPDSQYSKFKIVADNQIEARKKVAEEKRFNEAIEPIEELLDSAASLNSSLQSSEDSSDSSQIHQI